MSRGSRRYRLYLLVVAGVAFSPGIARGQCAEQWTGGDFALTPSISGAPIHAALVHDDGNGPGLFLAGAIFVEPGGGLRPVSVLAKWDGVTWSALGQGVYGTVLALAVYEGELIAGGEFTSAGGVAATRIARWDGEQWRPLGSGMNMPVHALAVFDGELIAGGVFGAAGGVAAHGVARWNGSEWHALDGGINGRASALLEYEGDLIVAGYFSMAGGTPASSVARWDGVGWRPLGDGFDLWVNVLHSYDGVLIAGGEFTASGETQARHIAQWNGAAWKPLGTGTNATVRALAVFDRDGPGLSPSALYVAGEFYVAGDVQVSRIAGWNGETWSAVGNGISRFSNRFVTGLCVFDDGTGPALYAGGDFGLAGGRRADRIAKWDGWTWSPLGTGLVNTTPYYLDVPIPMTVFDDGSGPALYVGGDFNLAGGVAVNNIARWDGSSWAPVGDGVNDWVDALIVFGNELIVGGQLTKADGVSTDFTAVWNGSRWRPMYGLIGTHTLSGVYCFEIYDGQLIAGGGFEMNGPVPSYSIARWDGARWQPLGTGLAGGSYPAVSAMTVYKDELIVGGSFTDAGGTPANFIARWDGKTWRTFGKGMNDWVTALTVFNGDLIAGGFFTETDGARTRHVARWNGSMWSPMEEGMTQPSRSYQNTVRAFAEFDDDGPGPTPPSLFAGGWFTEASYRPSVGVARWARPVLDVEQHPDDKAACTGTAVTFSVQACADEPIAYRWRRGTTPLSNGGNISGATTPSLTIDPVTLADAATDYNCLATTAAGSVSSHHAILDVFATGTGDGNGDGRTDGLDIAGFVDVLIDGGGPGPSFCAYDMNGDGAVDPSDVPPFVAVLLG